VGVADCSFACRRTAAASRERKKEQQVKLEHDNQRLRREVESLKLALQAREKEVDELHKAHAASPLKGAAGRGLSTKRSAMESAELILSLLLR
jgi:hypothetical protein